MNEDYFDSFCTRMWLDYCDENNDPISAPDRLDKEDYVTKWNDWLKEKYKEKYYYETTSDGRSSIQGR